MADKAEAASNLEQWKQEFYTDYSATEEQRDKSNEELRFAMVSGGQWEGYLEDSFEDRAKIELDQTAEYLYRTYGQWTENRVGVNYAPDDDASTDDDAELLDGLFRRDLRRRNGQSALDAGVFEAMACGYGAFHLNTEYEDDEDPDDTDQCIVFSELSNAYSTVVWDSAARRVDKADAERCTVLIPHSPEGFKRKYPDASPTSAVRPQGREFFNWSTPQLVWEAIRYEVRVEAVTVYTFGHPESEDMVRVDEKDLKDEQPELEAAGYEQLSKKRIKRRNVYKTKFCGGGLLEDERRIAGKYIPVIPLYAYRAHIDGVDYWHGVIRKRMDGQRLLNMIVSLSAEAASNATEDKPIFDPDQMDEGTKKPWGQDRHKVPYLLARVLRNEDGTIVQAGPVGMLSGATQAPAAQMLIQTVTELITRGTGGAPQDTIDPDASGKAVNAILKRVDMNTQPIFDNFKTAMRHCGEVYRHMAAEIYADRDGRNVNIVTEAGEMQRKTLLQMGVRGGAISYVNDPSRGRFEVVTDVGPSFQTQREEAVAALKDVIAAMDPTNELHDLVLGKIIELLPAQGMDDIKDYIRRKQLLAGLRQPETDEDKALLQQLAQSQGQPDPQSELLQSASQAQRAKAMESMARVGDLQASRVSKLARAALDNATRIKTLREASAPAPLRLVK
jgi:hypothetical protein